MTETDTQNIEKEIVSIFDSIRMDPKMEGYKFVVTAILLRYKKPSYRTNIYHGLFEEVAKTYKTKSHNIERNIRSLLEKTWTASYSEMQYELYGSIIANGKGKPTTAKFIECTVKIIEDRIARQK